MSVAAVIGLLRAWSLAGLAWLLIGFGAVHAGEAVPDRLRIGTDLPLAVLEDGAEQLSLAQVESSPPEAFRRLNAPFSGGFSNSTFWLRLDLPAGFGPDEERWLEIFPPIIDELDVFEPAGSGWKIHRSGDLRPFSGREIAHHHFIFRIHGNGEGKPIYLRVRSHKALAVNGSLWRSAAFTEAAIGESLGAGLYFGVWAIAMLTFIGYAIVFGYRSHYVLVIANGLTTLVVASLHGYHAQFLFPDHPAVASNAVPILVSLGMAVQVWLTRTILDTAGMTPRLDRGLFILSLVLAGSAALQFTDLWPRVSPWISLTSPFCAVVGLHLSIRHGRERRPGAKVLLVAFIVHALVAVPSTLTVVGLLPPFPILLSGWQLELPFHLLLIHAALVRRIWARKEALRRDLQAALDASRGAEKELERRVVERTRELDEAKQDVERALASERRALLEQRQFMSMVSHEFRTPLAVIDSVATNLAEIPLEGEADLTLRSNQIHRAVKRLARLVENCLADERVDGQALALQLQAVSPETLAREAADIVQWSPNHRLRLEFENLPAMILCDPPLVRMALSNLIDNAVKYSPGGEVAVRAWGEPGRVYFSVTDQGHGIPADKREIIFERFVRGDNVRDKHGVGLGLNVVRKIAELHSGSIDIADTGEAGTTFVLSLASPVPVASRTDPPSTLNPVPAALP
ncbi:MAG TPA: sensor histidine kinase [Rhodocyclaceae bacterium]|nr:sensor histidine kinase [Rhodocyclaceae bacterium]